MFYIPIDMSSILQDGKKLPGRSWCPRLVACLITRLLRILTSGTRGYIQLTVTSNNTHSILATIRLYLPGGFLEIKHLPTRAARGLQTPDVVRSVCLQIPNTNVCKGLLYGYYRTIGSLLVGSWLSFPGSSSAIISLVLPMRI